MTFVPDSGAASSLRGFNYIIPGFADVVVPASPTCYAINTAFSNPTCSAVQDGTTGDWTITVSGAKTSQNAYMIEIAGITNAPAARVLSTTTEPIRCISLTSSGAAIEDINLNGAVVFKENTLTSGIAITANEAVNGNTDSTLTIQFVTTANIVVSGGLQIGCPKQNNDYYQQTLGPVDYVSMIEADTWVGSETASWISAGGGSISLGSVSATVDKQLNADYINVLFSNTVELPAGGTLTVTVSPLRLAGNLKPTDGWEISTVDHDLYKIDSGSFMVLTNQEPGLPSTSGDRVTEAAIGTFTGVLMTGVTYSFKIFSANDIPQDGYFVLTVPDDVGVPTTYATDFEIVCLSQCRDSAVSFDMDWATRELKILNTYPNQSDYAYAPGPIWFQVTGWTNPDNDDDQYFTWTSYASLENPQGSGTFIDYKIDEIDTLVIAAETGECFVSAFYPNDTYAIYQEPTNYTFSVECEHDLEPEFGFRIAFPDTFYIFDESSCSIGDELDDPNFDLATGYSCVANNQYNNITMYNFATSTIAAGTIFSFQLSSIRNPGRWENIGSIEVFMLTAAGGVLDQGSYEYLEDEYPFVPGTIDVFTVDPENTQAGQFPVYYNFTVQPRGDIWEDAKLKLVLPPEVLVYNARRISQLCGGDHEQFTYFRLRCTVNGQTITISNGFYSEGTQNLTDSDGSFAPPILYFQVPQFINPRSIQPTHAFNISIESNGGETLYYWNNTEGPFLQMSGAATPQLFAVDRESEQNGAVTEYTFTVKTTNYIIDGDTLHFTLPSPAQFSEDSKCFGVTPNLVTIQPCIISTDLRTATISVDILSQTIESGGIYEIKITDVKNPLSYRPTEESFQYMVVASDGFEVEFVNEGYHLVNTEPGYLDIKLNSILPENFERGLISNYTIVLTPTNFLQNMTVVVSLPDQIKMGSEGLSCFGLQGTDVYIDDGPLKCSYNSKERQITLTHLFEYIVGSPGQIEILLEYFLNPDENVQTDSFAIETFTYDGYVIDQRFQNLTVNFFCEWPCASCDIIDTDKCYSCYGGIDERYWWDYTCIDDCPSQYYETTSNNCTACSYPCFNCTETADMCTSCVDGYFLFSNEFKCQEIIFWPFPFLCSGTLLLIIAIISECCTKGKSHFKETAIAFVALPEIGAWICYVIFICYRMGLNNSAALAVVGLLTHVILTLAFMLVHIKVTMNNCPYEYKMLMVDHRCSTIAHRVITYIFSFKFSMILISHFCNLKKYSGEYNAMNYRNFGRFGLAFIFVSFPIMIASAIHFLWYDGFWSYAGHVSIEVIILSTIMAILLLLDAFAGCYCGCCGRRSKVPSKKFEVNGEAEYESDDDTKKKKPHYTRDYEDDSRIYMDQDNQISVLEELVEQMRREREQAEHEKIKVEEERVTILHESEVNISRMEHHMEDYGVQIVDLQRQIDEFRLQRQDLIDQMDKRGTKTKFNAKERTNYRNFESEMDKAEVTTTPFPDSPKEARTAMPKPAFGRINENDSIHGSEQEGIVNIAPYKGGDSIQGLHDRNDSQQEYVTPYAYQDKTDGRRSVHKSDIYYEKDSAYHSQKSLFRDGSRPPATANNDYDTPAPNTAYYQGYNDQPDHVFMVKPMPERGSTRGKGETEVNQTYIAPVSAQFAEDSSGQWTVKGTDQAYVDARPMPHFADDSSGNFSAKVTDQDYMDVASNIPPKSAMTNNLRDIQTSQSYIVQNSAQFGSENGKSANERHLPTQIYMSKDQPSTGAIGMKSRDGDHQGGRKRRDSEVNIEKEQSEHMYFVNPAAMQEKVDDHHSRETNEDYQQVRPLPYQSDNNSKYHREVTASQQMENYRENAFKADSENNHQMNATEQQFFTKPQSAMRGDQSDLAERAATQQIELQQQNLAYHDKESDIQRDVTTQQYISRVDSDKLDKLTPKGSQTKEIHYYGRSEAEFGNISSRDPKTATGERFFDKPENNYGTAQDFNRQASHTEHHEVEVSASVISASDGRSASTEGEIAFHSAFTKADVMNKGIIRNNPKHVKKESDYEAMPGVVQVTQKRATASPVKQTTKTTTTTVHKQATPTMQKHTTTTGKKKTVIYSDKSESSFDEAMGDTPSNYNILNGRVDSKATMGLKPQFGQANNSTTSQTPNPAQGHKQQAFAHNNNQGKGRSASQLDTINEKRPPKQASTKAFVGSSIAGIHHTQSQPSCLQNTQTISNQQQQQQKYPQGHPQTLELQEKERHFVQHLRNTNDGSAFVQSSEEHTVHFGNNTHNQWANAEHMNINTNTNTNNNNNNQMMQQPNQDYSQYVDQEIMQLYNQPKQSNRGNNSKRKKAAIKTNKVFTKEPQANQERINMMNSVYGNNNTGQQIPAQQQNNKSINRNQNQGQTATQPNGASNSQYNYQRNKQLMQNNFI